MACFALVAVDVRAAPPPATTMDDPIAQYRERFKLGMDRYKAGAPAEAVGYWEPIYRELGDATHAAERLQAFLGEVDARRSRGEPIASIVTKEETDARDRVAGLVATKGRIHVDAGTPPRAAQVDASEPRLSGFVAWVTPGEHTVVFGPGAADQETRTVTVHSGEMLDVAPSPASPPAPPPSSAPTPPAAAGPSTAFAPPPPPPVVHEETRHPFSPAFIVLSGGLALGSAITAVPLEQHAWSLYNQYDGAGRTTAAGQSFYTARTWAYVTVGGAIGLAAATASIAAWYFLGTSTREVVVTPAGVAGRF
ncbi:MAG TPA: hypothetical protein VIJ22_15640 [Polyangiaceae bacterium]